jgi:glucose-1-phosphate thymidylyltransferase
MDIQCKTLGIILAAGKSSRLYPATTAVTKQLLPVYDKPLIYYPLSTMMLAGIRDILIIVNPTEKAFFEKLFEFATLQMGIDVQITIQEKPNGIAEAFTIAKQAKNFEQYENFVLILGDNVFHGATLTLSLQNAMISLQTMNIATIFAQKVVDPYRFGVVCLNRETFKVEYIIEKPKTLDSRYLNYAIPGLYFFPKNVVERAGMLEPSARGEVEITDLIGMYLGEDQVYVEIFKRGISWFDTGTADSLLDAAHYVKTIQTNQGFLVGSPHEVAIRNKWVEDLDVLSYLKTVEKSSYGKLLAEAFLNG